LDRLCALALARSAPRTTTTTVRWFRMLISNALLSRKFSLPSEEQAVVEDGARIAVAAPT
jgi:hypothetical protein